MKWKKIKKNIFFDKNRNIIQIGNKLKIPFKLDFFFKDGIVIEKDGQLGLNFKYQDFFIPLSTLTDDFFKNCEIIDL